MASNVLKFIIKKSLVKNIGVLSCKLFNKIYNLKTSERKIEFLLTRKKMHFGGALFVFFFIQFININPCPANVENMVRC